MSVCPVPKKAETRRKARRAMQLREEGMSFADIGQELGIGERRAHQLYHAYLSWVDAQHHSSGALDRRLEDRRLDRILAAHLPLAESGDVDSANLCIRLAKRRAELHALDLPTEQIVTVRRESEWQGQLESLRSHYPDAYAFLMREAFRAVEGDDSEPLQLTVIPSQTVIPTATEAIPSPLSSNDYDGENIGNVEISSQSAGITKLPPCPSCQGTGQAPVVHFGKDGRPLKKRGRKPKTRDDSLGEGAGI